MRTWSPKATRWAAALAVLLACGSAWADLLGEPLPPIPPPEVKPLPSAPEEPAPQEPPAEPAPPPRSGLRRENVLLIGGEPQALFWADGLAQAEDLPAYKALGFNAVRVPVTSAGGEALARAERLAEAAEQAGLFVLADLRPEGAAFETEGAGAPHSPLDVSYRAAVRRFVRAAAPRLLARKTLAGWVVSGVDAEAVHYSQSDFWSYLQVWHGGLSEINAAWGSAFPTALHITDAAIEKLDAGRTGGVGRATLDLARYRQRVYADLLGLWADEIHEVDRSHAVLAGGVYNYRSAISVPGEKFEGSVCGFFPGLCETDVLTHNAQGIDIARRGNHLAALPVLTTDLAVPASQVATWVAEAVVHGAAGVGFSNWETIRADPALQRAIGDAIGLTRGLGLCPSTPRARTAIVYQPYAAGAVQAGLPLYGYARGLSDREPGRLFAALRRGTRFGPVDYLTERELLSVTPERYGVVLAPLAVYLPEGAQRAVARYVAQGGVFVADLGVGMYQSGGDITAPPPTLVRLFGLQAVVRVAEQGPVVNVLTKHERFPSLQVGDSPSETFWSTPMAGFTTFLTVATDVVPVLTSFYEAREHGGFCGLLMRASGKGWALYGTTRLWEEWLPGNAVFEKVFGDLMGPGCTVAVKAPAGLTSACEVAPYADGGLLIHNSGGSAAQVLVENPEGRVYRMPGGVQSVRPKETSGNSLLMVPAGRLMPAQALPVSVTPVQVPAYVQVLEYSEKQIVLAVHGGQSRVRPDAEGRLAVLPAGAVEVDVTVKDGAYPVAPRSAHLVTGKPLSKGKAWHKACKADAAGVVSFRCASAGSLITIRRAKAEEARER